MIIWANISSWPIVITILMKISYFKSQLREDEYWRRTILQLSFISKCAEHNLYKFIFLNLLLLFATYVVLLNVFNVL